MQTNIHIWSYLAQFFLEWEMFQKNFLPKIKTYFCSITFFLGHRVVYEICGKKILDPENPQMRIWRMRIACYIPKATNTHSQYVILIAFPLQQLFHERAWMLHYTFIACLVKTQFLEWQIFFLQKLKGFLPNNQQNLENNSNNKGTCIIPLCTLGWQTTEETC